MANKAIQILINAKDEASAVFLNLKKTVVAVGGALAAYLGVTAFVNVVKGAAEFEQAMSRVQAATGASAAEMKELKKAAEDAGASSKFSSVEAAGALENLAKAGLNAKDAITTLPAALRLAEAGDMELAQSAEVLTKAVMGMGLAFSEAGRVADVLALGANATNTSVLGLAQALSYTAPIAHSLGVSLESTVAIIGKFADAGIDAGRAGTALNSILSQFADPASKFRNELAAAGITTGNFEKALHQLAEAGPKGAKAIIAVGQEAGPALRALLNQGMGALDELTGKLKNAEGSAAATAEVMRNNLNSSLQALANAWKYVTDTLGTPVLPVLKQAVDELAAAFRGAVADGTIGKFGEAIATAFTQAIKFTREFLSNFNFADAVARLQKFADDTNENLTLVAKYAGNAANSVKLAYAVMSGGANAVLVGIYGIASAYVEASIQIVSFAAKASDALAKIAVGDAKERLKREAEEMRAVLGGLAAVRDAFLLKTQESLDAAAVAAQAAREGFAGMAAPLKTAGKEADTTSAALAQVAKELQAGAEAAAKAGAAYQKKINDEQLARKAADEHREAIKQLRAEYEKAVSNKDWQTATEVQERLSKALRESKSSAEELAEAAKQVEAAFGRLGVKSTAALKDQAASALADYQTIKNAGTSTAEDLQRAFEKAAQAAIDANKGVAPSWVQAEAGVRGYRIEVDAAGKSHLELVNKAAPGLDRLAKGWHATREAIEAQNDALDKLAMKYTMTADYTERQIKLLEREAAAAEKAAEAYRKKWNMDKEGYSLNTAGERVNAGESQSDVDKDVANRYGANNVNNADAQRARQLNKMLQLISQQGGLISDPGTSKQIADMRRELQDLEAKLLNGSGASGGTAPSKGERSAAAPTPAPAPAPAPSGAPAALGAVITHRVVIERDKEKPVAINTDEQGALALVNQLSRARGTSI